MIMMKNIFKKRNNGENMKRGGDTLYNSSFTTNYWSTGVVGFVKNIAMKDEVDEDDGIC